MMIFVLNFADHLFKEVDHQSGFEQQEEPGLVKGNERGACVLPVAEHVVGKYLLEGDRFQEMVQAGQEGPPPGVIDRPVNHVTQEIELAGHGDDQYTGEEGDLKNPADPLGQVDLDIERPGQGREETVISELSPVVAGEENQDKQQRSPKEDTEKSGRIMLPSGIDQF